MKITCGTERKIKRMQQLWISLVVVSDEDVQEIVLPIWIGRSSESKDLARLAVGINDVEMLVRPETESAQLAQFHVVR